MKKSVKGFPLFLLSCRAYKYCIFGLYAFSGFYAAETLEFVKGDVEVHFDVIVPADADGLDKLCCICNDSRTYML